MSCVRQVYIMYVKCGFRVSSVPRLCLNYVKSDKCVKCQVGVKCVSNVSIVCQVCQFC